MIRIYALVVVLGLVGGAVCIALGLMILFMAPLAKIAAGLAIAWGVWTIWKSE